MILPNNLWVEKYRPSKLEDYVWINAEQKKQVEAWIAEGEIPHLLLSGGPGCGKTTLAKLILKEMKVHDSDIRYVNASKETGIDYLRSLVNFCETIPYGKFRYVLLDEADRLSVNAQDMLKNTIEEYSAICRWIFTTNRPNKILAPLQSRLAQGFHVEALDKEQFVTRLATILLAEGIDLNEENLEILDEYVTVTYPDLRRCLNLLEQHCKDGQLRRPKSVKTETNSDYLVQAVSLFKSGKIHEARKLICSNASEGDYEDIYKLLYQNLSWWGDDEDKQHRAIVIIANRLKDHSLVADPEIALAACLVELSML